MERLGDEVRRELGRSGSAGAGPLVDLTAAWPSLVGDAIARHAWPLRISRDDTLHLATTSAAWASELTLMADEILDRLREGLAEPPARLRFAVGPVPEPAAAEPPAAEPAPPSVPREVAEDAAVAASEIADPELRELVLRAARASLARAASDRHF